MPKPTLPVVNFKSRSGQLLPYTLFGMIVFAWVSSAHFEGFLSAYLVLLAIQLGTVGIYLLLRQLKSQDNINRNLKGR